MLRKKLVFLFILEDVVVGPEMIENESVMKVVDDVNDVEQFSENGSNFSHHTDDYSRDYSRSPSFSESFSGSFSVTLSSFSGSRSSLGIIRPYTHFPF